MISMFEIIMIQPMRTLPSNHKFIFIRRLKFHEQYEASILVLIEESNKFLVFKYSEGDAVLEITLKEMPFSLFATAYLIKVPARCDDEVSMMMKQ